MAHTPEEQQEWKDEQDHSDGERGTYCVLGSMHEHRDVWQEEAWVEVIEVAADQSTKDDGIEGFRT